MEDKDKDKDDLDKNALMKLVVNEKSQYLAAKKLMVTIFTQEELSTHSVSGKAPNSKCYF